MSTTPRRFVLNAPSIAGDVANVTYVVLSASGATLIASTGAGVVALAAGYRVMIAYDESWASHGEFVWSYRGVQVASETFDVPGTDAILRILQSAGSITVSQMVPGNGGSIRITRGDDYRSSEGMALKWTFETNLDLTGATGTFDILLPSGQSLLGSPVALVITAVPGVGYDLLAELTNTLTSALPAGLGWRYKVRVTLSNGHQVTISEGHADVVT